LPDLRRRTAECLQKKKKKTTHRQTPDKLAIAPEPFCHGFAAVFSPFSI